MVLRLKMFSATLLISCLLFLTCSNYFLYTFCNSAEVELLSDLPGEENMPIAPEEKSTNNSISIQEEYVHDSDHENDNLAFDKRTRQTIIDIAELRAMHFELVSPPPDVVL